ncbi:hypothetical protein FB567DRAFT_129184 [Paraphoma chrysanthemicola]|uniref:Uncharacterized protein n=1 Tax=Paraphoma chrysanthemicola TaxID=798071 RepID=A0A8K0QZK2_9PLEO|nr:hypothetical protein FB567DRAFT_129184 [Paraphoma chrysanthemicola]
MRNSFISSILLISGAAVLSAAQDDAKPPGIESFTDSGMTKRLIEYWSDSQCFRLSDNSEPNPKEQCKEACFPDGVTSDVPAGQFVQSSQSCWYNGIESDFRTGKPLTDEEKNQSPRTVKSITTGYCICDDPIINIAGDFFVESVLEAGKILNKVMCPTLLALDLVVELGSAAIPGVGKAITVGMRPRFWPGQ